MFTGIITDLGILRQLNRRAGETELEILTAYNLEEVKLGDSIAVNGACLTVTEKKDRSFFVYVSAETLNRTNLRFLKGGDRVNLEKSLRLCDLVGGHLVLGHVDGMGRIIERREAGSSVIFGFEGPEELGRYIVAKGSVAVDGVSLTVNDCIKGRFYVNVIPHTLQTTTLGRKRNGDLVNIETDIIGKYVERLLHGQGGIDREFLAKYGIIK